MAEPIEREESPFALPFKHNIKTNFFLEKLKKNEILKKNRKHTFELFLEWVDLIALAIIKSQFSRFISQKSKDSDAKPIRRRNETPQAIASDNENKISTNKVRTSVRPGEPPTGLLLQRTPLLLTQADLDMPKGI